MENDERCLLTFIAIMRVVIDWAYSEPELCFILFKSFTLCFSQMNFQQFKNIFQRLKTQHLQQSSHIIQHIQESPSSLDNINEFKFNIEELHGEKLISKQIVISTQPKYSILEKSEDDFELQYNFEAFQNSFLSFCEELMIKLNQLTGALNFPSEKICQNLSLIISIILNEK
uniref:N-terminal Ras-GEF domain-containing protein n=1 Tax=Meloidogyne hapla TaxID=6305 RepID=A0A1I8B2T9_MELHA